MRHKITFLLCLFGAAACADTLTLKDGRTIQGAYVGGDTRNVKMLVDGNVQTFDVSNTQSLQFGDGAQASITPAPAATGGGWQQAPSARPAPPATANAESGGATANAGPIEAPPRIRRHVDDPSSAAGAVSDQPAVASAPTGPVVPQGAEIAIRMIDDVDSERDSVGKTYKASLAKDVVVDGQTVIPVGADVTVKLVSDEKSGKITGKTVLTLDLTEIKVNGKMVDLDTNVVNQESSSRGKRSAGVIGGATALGAIIGAVAGGGAGAAIGAASGAAVGTGAQVMTKGQRVKIPTETKLTFTLQQPLQL